MKPEVVTNYKKEMGGADVAESRNITMPWPGISRSNIIKKYFAT